MLSCSASSGEFCWHSHWKNESKAHSLHNNCRNISIPLKTAAFRRSLMDGRQLFPYQIMEGLLVILALFANRCVQVQVPSANQPGGGGLAVRISPGGLRFGGVSR